MEEKTSSFPYKELVGIVLVSALVTVAIFWIWHRVEMARVSSLYERDMERMRTSIAVLEAHVATFATSSSPTP